MPCSVNVDTSSLIFIDLCILHSPKSLRLQNFVCFAPSSVSWNFKIQSFPQTKKSRKIDCNNIIQNEQKYIPQFVFQFLGKFTSEFMVVEG